MRRLLFAAVLLCASMSNIAPVSAQGTPSCADFDAYEWVQAVFESDPDAYDALDPDGDGQACPDLPRGGFAPAFWLDEIPEDVEEVQLIRIVDGDTFEVLIDGVSNRVRIYRADTPETQNEQQCGGEEATAFADFALSFNETPGTVFLERDKTLRDRYGRELAYIWFEIDGLPYMLNHILVNSGWADDVDYGDRKYDDEFKEAAAFAKRNDLGVWAQCGGFGQPLPSEPTQSAPQPDPTEQPAQSEPPEAGGGCDPNYTPCIPAYPPDVNCGDIGITVQVIGGDPHGLDRDNDGVACESN